MGADFCYLCKSCGDEFLKKYGHIDHFPEHIIPPPFVFACEFCFEDTIVTEKTESNYYRFYRESMEKSVAGIVDKKHFVEKVIEKVLVFFKRNK